MTEPHTHNLWEAYGAALALPHAVAIIGGSLRMYLALLLAANHDGLVIRRAGRFAEDLSVPGSEVEGWVTRLGEAQLIEILSPSPFLAIRLRFWCAESPSLAENAELSAEERDSYSNSSNAAIALSSNTGVRGLGEGEDLRAKIRTVLPDAEPAEIECLLVRYPPAILRKTLDRVEKTPPEKIRKSKAALFRFLLAKFSQEIDVHDL